ncbi:hypothetical protein LZ554_005442 [Drepanopeziza brunnea f. sp. 'monogermtubi']|nr:hypothetical protein LZ554_005442 [Drepanopeziza brunnea f. sp. 'monogermtubi']
MDNQDFAPIPAAVDIDPESGNELATTRSTPKPISKPTRPGYAPYSAALYVLTGMASSEKFVLLGGGTWLTPAKQPESGSIQLSPNAQKKQRGKVGYGTYRHIILTGLQCAGLLLAFLISPPEKAIRWDGSRIAVDPATTTKNKAVLGEFRRAWRLLPAEDEEARVPPAAHPSSWAGVLTRRLPSPTVTLDWDNAWVRTGLCVDGAVR